MSRNNGGKGGKLQEARVNLPSSGGGGGGSSGMILAGCPRCMMYVMLSREDPKCPKCHSTVLLDFNDAAAAADPRQVGAGKSKGKHRG
uniref:GIR1-like zinc ribbon domain-containing protein n=1 Tax=Oryza glumipatula TaxID=40148 RepID=A0A0D9ZZU8_9ORYZ